MKLRRLLLFFLMTIFLSVAVGAEELVTSQRAVLVPERGSRLSNDTKEKLSQATKNRAFTGAVYLMPQTLVKVQSRNTFDLREEYRARGSATPESVRRTFQAAYVEVASGEHEGTSGWVVVSFSSDKESPITYLRPAPANFQERQTAQAQHQEALDTGVDLQLSISRGDSRMQVAGKEVFSITVANVGGENVRENFNVTVEVDGKNVKTERVRGLAPRGSHYFNVEISESVARRGGTVVVTVDPENVVQEVNKSNNVWRSTLSARQQRQDTSTPANSRYPSSRPSR